MYSEEQDLKKFTVRLQDITLPVEAASWNDEPTVFKYLEKQNEDDYKELFEMMNPNNNTFVDQLAAATDQRTQLHTR